MKGFITKVTKIFSILLGGAFGEMLHSVTDIVQRGSYIEGDGLTLGSFFVMLGMIIHWIQIDSN